MGDPALLPPLAVWAVCAVAAVLGTCLQRLSGAGFGMLLAPVMTIVAEPYVPGTILLLGLVVGLGSFLSARDAIHPGDLPPGFAGRLLGAVLAALVASLVVGSSALPIIVACIVLFAVGLSLAGLSLSISRRSLFGAGLLGGVMGTLTGVGAPPMAILYSTVDTRRSAASQNAFFGFGMLVSISALAVAGLIRAPQLAFAASLLPLVVLGLWISRPLAARFERAAIRPWALGLATLAAVTLLVRSL